MSDKERGKDSRNSATKNQDGDPKSVGKNTSHRAEDVARGNKEAGRKDAGTTGKTNRPVGTSTARDSTGVDPQDPIDPSSPNLPRGGG